MEGKHKSVEYICAINSSQLVSLWRVQCMCVVLLPFLCRPSKYWDIPPRGFEHISPLQFKAMQGKLTVWRVRGAVDEEEV